MHFGSTAPSGELAMRRLGPGGSLTATPAIELPFASILRHAFPHPFLSGEVFRYRLRNLPNIARGLWRIAAARALKISHFYGTLSIVKIDRHGNVLDYGIVSLRVVTTAGVNFLVDTMQNLQEPENFKFHGIGTGTGAEAVGDTALGTELTTEYATDNTRPTGSQTENGSNVYRTVATITLDSGTPAITEHGVFNQAANSGGTLLDRSKFSAINLTGANGDGIQATYDFTINAGG